MLRFLKSKPRKSLFAQIDLKDATVTVRGGGSGESIEIQIGEGNVSFSEKRNVQYTLDRGALDEVRLGDEVPVDVTLSFTWKYIVTTASTTVSEQITAEQALKANVTAWSSSDADPCRPKAVDIVIAFAPDCDNDKTITLADFRWEQMDYDLRAATVSTTGKCNLTEATVVDS